MSAASLRDERAQLKSRGSAAWNAGCGAAVQPSLTIAEHAVHPLWTIHREPCGLAHFERANPSMAKVSIRVEHTLGAAEVERRIRAAAAMLEEKKPGIVRSITWNGGRAHASGDGFEGDLVITERDFTASVELGWKLAFFPLKVQREAEAWLAQLLR